MDTMPTVMWFVRSHMRRDRGGLSMARFRALVHIDREPSAAVSNVAEHLAVTKATASRVVSGLVDDGYVRRSNATNGADRRVISLALTPRGKALLRSAQDRAHDLLARELDGMSDADRRTISRAMDLLRDRFGAVSESRPGIEIR